MKMNTAIQTVILLSTLLTACGGGETGAGSNSTTTTNATPPSSTEPEGIPPLTPGADALFISPGGNDANDCLSATTPCKTFANVFGRIAAGGEVVLMDGSYAASTTGVMHWDTSTYSSRSAQIPSGTSTRHTYVHALNPGQAVVDGLLFVGRSTRKDSYITVRGLRFEGGVSLYNTSHVILKDTGVHGPLGVGTNDHDNGNTDNLVEDVWVWASGQRVIAINYRAHRNVWRRVIVRGDGCGTADCTGSGNPNVGFTVYDSHDISVQNVMVLDRVLNATDSPYADFAIASHTGVTSADYRFGRNEWLGTISLNAPDTGYYMEPDAGTTVGSATEPTVRISNAVAWNATAGGFNFARSGEYFQLEHLLAQTTGGDAIRVAPDLSGFGSLTDVIILGSGRYALNSAFTASHVNISGSFTGNYNQTTPTDVVAGNPLANGALKYVTRQEATAAQPQLVGTGSGGGNIGPTILYRHGADGALYGQSGYNTLTATSLWPWPNESRIKNEMCQGTTRGFCSTGKQLDGTSAVTLTSYVWEIIGNAQPSQH